MIFLFMLIVSISLFLPQDARADVIPERRVIHFTRAAVRDRYRFPLYFQCTEPDREVKGISVSGINGNGASISHSVHHGTNGMGKYLELIPVGGPGTVSMTVTATGDSGRSYKTMMEIIVE